MSILVNENLLRLHYLKETGKERPLYTPVSDYGEYVEWLEEKLSIVIQEQDEMNKYYQKFLPKNTGKMVLDYQKKI